ncbi:tetR family protein [Corynebacterium lowii]|uniref:TetR family protein n=1 Tax=Corynebacterium lowii TaxID=1544413 RepID=A0A0Q0UL69_9CORY|nr:tetR family protein [Corynebacterium lowii]
MDTAASLFISHGEATSMRSIAEAAGVGVGTLYRHFPDRDALVNAIAIEKFSQVIALTSGVTSAEQWAEFSHAMSHISLGQLAPALSSLRPDPEPREVVEYRARAFEELERVLGLAREAGLIRGEITVIRFLLGLMACTRPLPAGAPEVFVKEMDWLRENFVQSLRP